MRALKTLTIALSLTVALGPAVIADEEPTSYGYVRTLEGSGAILSADTGGVEEMGLNQPVLSGDRVVVDPGSRVELVLPDFNIVRLGGDTEVELSRLAFSAETEERVTTLLLTGGEMQVVVTEYALGDELPAVVLPNATVFLHEPGSYRISAYDDFALVTVREGYAEISTDRGSAIARGSEAVRIEGESWPAVEVLEATYPDDLERWGDELLVAAEESRPDHVDPALGYSASALQEAGEWVEVEGETAWSPYVEESWRPYTRGSWTTTPAGMHWVGYEPWGYVTGHYGRWSLHSRWGWLWYPGAAWAPAWVHWYWGPNWVGWVPFGYYNGFYGNHLGLHMGFYGHAGGYWHHYSNWTFCPTYTLGHGSGNYHSGRDMPHRTGRTAVPRGVITTDTRGVTAQNWRDGVLVGKTLTEQAQRTGRVRESVDVTPFVARERELDSTVVASVSGTRSRGGREQVSRQPADRQSRIVASAPRSGVSLSTSSLRGGRATARSSSSALTGTRSQAWRENSGGRKLVSVNRGTERQRAADAGRQSAFESAGRVRQAWRSESVDSRRGYAGRSTREGGWLSRGSGSRYGGTVRSDSPARRVIEGVRSPSRGDARSGLRSSTRSGSSRSTPSTRSRGGSRPSPKSSRASSSNGSNRRSSASSRSGSSGKRSSSGGRARSSAGSRSGGSKSSATKSNGGKSSGGSAAKSRSGGSRSRKPNG